MMPALRVGLIGCGQIAQSVHLKVLSRLPSVELAAIADPDADRRAAAQRQAPDAVAVADYWDLLQLPQLDAVVIALPNALHAEVAKLALQQGRHVYLEKPIAIALDDARALVAAWRGASVVGMVGFNHRFNPLYLEARECVRSGRLGEILCMRTVFSTAGEGLPEWKRHRAGGGGALLDLASHHIDFVRFVFGSEIVEVVCQLQSRESEADCATLHLRLSDGVTVQSFFSLCAVEDDRIEVYGRHGKLAVDRYGSGGVEVSAPLREGSRWQRFTEPLRAPVRAPYLLQKLRAVANEPSFQAALAHFVHAARLKQSASPDLYDGYQSLAVIDAAETSARYGRVVSPRSSFVGDLRRVTPQNVEPVKRSLV